MVRQPGAAMIFPLSDRLIEKEQTHIRRCLNALNAGEFHVYSTGTSIWRRLTLHLSQKPAASCHFTASCQPCHSHISKTRRYWIHMIARSVGVCVSAAFR